MRSIEIVSNSIINNISKVIEIDNNMMFDVLLKRREARNELYGYENFEEYETKITKALILFKPELRFLKSIGIDYDSEFGGIGELPIICYFKEFDDVKMNDEIYIINNYTKGSKDYKLERGFRIIDVKTRNYGYTIINFYLLANIR